MCVPFPRVMCANDLKSIILYFLIFMSSSEKQRHRIYNERTQIEASHSLCMCFNNACGGFFEHVFNIFSTTLSDAA